MQQKEVITEAINRFKDLLDEIWLKVVGIIKRNGPDLQQQLKDIQETKAEINFNRDNIKKTLEDVENLKRSVSVQLEEWRERYTADNINVELFKQGNSFNKLARDNERKSYYWIIGIVISTLILIGLLWCFTDLVTNEIISLKARAYLDYMKICKTCSEKILWLYFAKNILLRALIISINIYAIRFCVKNYNACKHNQIINDQRQASFDVAFHFYNTIVSEKKDDILFMAANSIFSHQNTGYMGKESEPANPAIIEKIFGKAEDILGKSTK